MREILQSLKVGTLCVIGTPSLHHPFSRGRLVERTHFGGRIELDDRSQVVNAGIVNLIFTDGDKFDPLNVFMIKGPVSGIVEFFVNPATSTTPTLPDLRTDRATG